MTAPIGAFAVCGCEVRCDAVTRQLYATDASHYQIEPAAVAFPRSPQQAADAIDAARAAGIPVTPRGAGSGLVGGALGAGLVIDFARHNQEIWDFNADAKTVRVGAGVVLDQLNTFLRPHGLSFGPDVATSSRATIGGMIANNSSGARTPLYGTTADHVAGVESVTADGRIISFQSAEIFRTEMACAERIVAANAPEILRRMPSGLLKRWPGYALDRCLRGITLANLLAGSEGTLAGITSAELRLVTLPVSSGLGLIFFSSVAEAMQATVELLDLAPAAIEHIDDVLTDQTRGQREFRAARDLLELDAYPAKSILVVEFYDHVTEKLAELARRNLGLRQKLISEPAEMNLVWSLRKAGLALLTGRKGRAKPVTCIEDTAVRPAQLPAYVAALQSILDPLGVQACFYGHAAAGLLHVRPVLDLRNADDLVKFRRITSEVSAAVRQFNGSFAAEHGVGIARTEFMREQLGDALLNAMREIKNVFDPGNILNPGKLFDDGQFRLDTQLRTAALVQEIHEPVLAFAARDESFLANLEQCNGCGGCRKLTATMCPTFLVTGEEAMTTRGRANVIRAALSGHSSEGLASALESCLSCKACATECPSNVNMPLLKAELLHQQQHRLGLSLRARALSRVDLLGAAAATAPRFMNAALDSPILRRALKHVLGITDRRSLPHYTDEPFHWWFRSRSNTRAGTRGRVLLWDDCFVRYNEPGIGRAATTVLERAGYEVGLLCDRACCGRPAFSQGNLAEAQRMGDQNVDVLRAESKLRPFEAVIFLEPSCFSMFAEDYRELKVGGAQEFSDRAILFEHFINDLLDRAPNALTFAPADQSVAIHAHCHAKALTNTSAMTTLAKRLPGRSVAMLDTGCCGMAGAFGVMEKTYDLSLEVAAPLVHKIAQQPPKTIVVASGTSCRQQITHTTPARPLHMAELLAGALSREP